MKINPQIHNRSEIQIRQRKKEKDTPNTMKQQIAKDKEKFLKGVRE